MCVPIRFIFSSYSLCDDALSVTVELLSTLTASRERNSSLVSCPSSSCPLLVSSESCDFTLLYSWHVMDSPGLSGKKRHPWLYLRSIIFIFPQVLPGICGPLILVYRVVLFSLISWSGHHFSSFSLVFSTISGASTWDLCIPYFPLLLTSIDSWSKSKRKVNDYSRQTEGVDG